MKIANSIIGLALITSVTHAATPLIDLTFEDDSWKPWTVERGGKGSISVVSPGNGNSKYAGAISVKGRTGGLIVLSPTYQHMQAGQLYEVTADIKPLNPYCTSLLQNYEGILVAIGPGLNNATMGQWSTYKTSFFPQQTNESLSIAVFCVVPAGKKAPRGPVFEYDNIIVTPGKKYTSTSKPTGSNLVQQPNFDSGTLEAYQVLTEDTASVDVVKQGYNGAKYAAHLNLQGVFARPANVEILQTIPSSKAEDIYKIGFAWRHKDKLPFTCGGVSYIQQGGFPNGTEYIPYQQVSFFPTNSSNPPPAGKWSQVEGWVSGLSDKFQMGIEAQCLFDHGNIELDALSLVPYS